LAQPASEYNAARQGRRAADLYDVSPEPWVLHPLSFRNLSVALYGSFRITR
jgi:hypothetical protein